VARAVAGAARRRRSRIWVDPRREDFRVDKSAHTKTLRFWEVADPPRFSRARDPDGAVPRRGTFTRPAVMRYLAKAGFTQSYTYFTWCNSKRE